MSEIKYILQNRYNKEIPQYIRKYMPAETPNKLQASQNRVSYGAGLSYVADMKGRIAQEQHHAMHALWFFYFMAIRTVKGERVKRRSLARIIHHLMDLREFLEDGRVNNLSNELRRSVQVEYDDSLFSIMRAVNKWIKDAVIRVVEDENNRFFMRVSAFLITFSEGGDRSQICMYPWLIGNQDKVLEFADYYGKKDIFKGLLPIGKKSDNGKVK